MTGSKPRGRSLDPAKELVFKAYSEPSVVAERLELDVAYEQSNGVMLLCPFHDDSKPSGSLFVGDNDKVRFFCHGCGESHDIIGLAALHWGMNPKRDFKRILAHLLALAGFSEFAKTLNAGRKLRMSDIAKATDALKVNVEKREPAKYPDAGRIYTFFVDNCQPVNKNRDVATYLKSRGLDPTEIAKHELAWAIKFRQRHPMPVWAKTSLKSWVQSGHFLVTPTFDEDGYERSLRARCVRDCDPAFKSLAPSGKRCSGTVFANLAGRQLFNPKTIAGPLPEGLEVVVVIVEGEIDFMTWATRPAPEGKLFVVLGVFSGAWCQAIADRIPDGTTVVVRTDPDEAGNRYAGQINETLKGRCRVLRPKGY